MGLADRRTHASKCYCVSSVVQWRQNIVYSVANYRPHLSHFWAKM